MNATVGTAPSQQTANQIRIDDLKLKAQELGSQAGQGKDTQIKFLLACMDGGYHNAVDTTPGRHGPDRDDATALAEIYVNAQGTATVFDAKAGNQRKLVSTLRTAIKLGQWPKGGSGEPLTTVNNFMSERAKLRKDPKQAKLLDDAANSFLRFARAQLKRDTIIEPKEFKDFLNKAPKDDTTVEDILVSARKKLSNLQKGANGKLDNSAEIKTAVNALTQRLAAIAKAKGSKV